MGSRSPVVTRGIILTAARPCHELVRSGRSRDPRWRAPARGHGWNHRRQIRSGRVRGHRPQRHCDQDGPPSDGVGPISASPSRSVERMIINYYMAPSPGSEALDAFSKLHAVVLRHQGARVFGSVGRRNTRPGSAAWTTPTTYRTRGPIRQVRSTVGWTHRQRRIAPQQWRWFYRSHSREGRGSANVARSRILLSTSSPPTSMESLSSTASRCRRTRWSSRRAGRAC
ncbi:hypothetical protein ENSA7_69080 [Enhygromyxa salina]|uniref:Uncharacterized protein n=1 Tax=Enhygromyxa salina TaxID=215803 RepID=A0A2S9XTC8_9BACT|nr:hypothetical protein ENSA7_69080 [Enhygromyxa salina]